MKKTFYVSMIGVLAVATSCTSTGYLRTSGYTDDLYGGQRGAAPVVEKTYTVVTPQNSYNGNTVQQNQPQTQAYTQQGTAARTASVNTDEYYPGMFEEALTGTINTTYDGASTQVQQTGKPQETNITINLNYDPWGWDGYYRPSWYAGTSWGWGLSWGPSWNYWDAPWSGPWYNGWYGPAWAGGWYGRWNPWYNDPWYGNPWYGNPWYGWHGHPHYDSRYNRNNTVYTGNRRSPGTMLGSRPANQPTRDSYESGFVRQPTSRPGNGQTSISSRPSINNGNTSSTRPSQEQVDQARTTTRRPVTSNRNESSSNNNNNSWQRPSNSGSSSGTTSRPSYSNPAPVRNPTSSGSINRGSSGGGGISSGSSSGGGVRRR